MQKHHTLDEYVKYFDQVAKSRCAFIIKKYFNGDVDKFYDAPRKFEIWRNSPQIKRAPTTDSVWHNIRCCNFAGIEKKYVRSIFGHNYLNSNFMESAWAKLKDEFGYTIIPHGTLPYKDKRDHYPTKYLPPKKQLEDIFKDKKMVSIVTNPESYCNKVKKVLKSIMNDNIAKKDVEFKTPDEVLSAFKKLLDTNKVGSPTFFKSSLLPILTPYLFDEATEYWSHKSSSIKFKFDYAYWYTDLPSKDKIDVSQTRLDFYRRIMKQLDGPDAVKMFKDYKVNGMYIQADSTRIEKARQAIKNMITRCELSIEEAEKEESGL